MSRPTLRHWCQSASLSYSLFNRILLLLAGVLTRIQSRAWQRPLSSCSSLTTSSTWLAQRRLLPTTSKTSPSGLDFLTVGGFTWALHRPMVTLPPLAPKNVSSKEKNLFRTSLFAAGQKVSPLAGSRCCCQDCLSATDSKPDSPAQSRRNTFTF